MPVVWENIDFVSGFIHTWNVVGWSSMDAQLEKKTNFLSQGKLG